MGKPLPKLAPRRAPDSAAVDAFIRGEAASPAPAIEPIQAAPLPPAEPVSAPSSSPTASSPVAPSPPPPAPPAAAQPVPSAPSAAATELPTAPSPLAGRMTVQRKDGRALSRKTVYLPPELGTRLAVYAARNGLDQSEIVSAALAAWLDQKGA